MLVTLTITTNAVGEERTGVVITKIIKVVAVLSRNDSKLKKNSIVTESMNMSTRPMALMKTRPESRDPSTCTSGPRNELPGLEKMLSYVSTLSTSRPSGPAARAQSWSPACAIRMSSSMARVAISAIMGRSISGTAVGRWNAGWWYPEEPPLRRSRSSDGPSARLPSPPTDRSSDDDMDSGCTGGSCVKGRPRYLDVRLDTRSSCNVKRAPCETGRRECNASNVRGRGE